MCKYEHVRGPDRVPYNMLHVVSHLVVSSSPIGPWHDACWHPSIHPGSEEVEDVPVDGWNTSADSYSFLYSLSIDGSVSYTLLTRALVVDNLLVVRYAYGTGVRGPEGGEGAGGADMRFSPASDSWCCLLSWLRPRHVERFG